MKILITIIFFNLCSQSYAGWICEKAASIKEGNNIMSCGVALGENESIARQKALLNAKLEFKAICEDSYDCRSYETIVTPLRNSCSKISNSKYKCYRGLQYRILKMKISNRSKDNDHFDQEIKKIEDEIYKRESVLNKKRHLLLRKKKLASLNTQIKGKILPPIEPSKQTSKFLNLNSSMTQKKIKKNHSGFTMDFNGNEIQSEAKFSYVEYNHKNFGYSVALNFLTIPNIHLNATISNHFIDPAENLLRESFFYSLTYQGFASFNLSKFLFNFGAGGGYISFDETDDLYGETSVYSLGSNRPADTSSLFWLTSLNIHYLISKHFSFSIHSSYKSFGSDYMVQSGLVTGLGLSYFL